MKAKRSFIRALTLVGATIVFAALSVAPAIAQAASPDPSASASAVSTQAPGPPASYYASYGLLALGGLTVLAMLAGYLFQAPGFRRGKGAPAGD